MMSDTKSVAVEQIAETLLSKRDAQAADYGYKKAGPTSSRMYMKSRDEAALALEKAYRAGFDAAIPSVQQLTNDEKSQLLLALKNFEALQQLITAHKDRKSLWTVSEKSPQTYLETYLQKEILALHTAIEACLPAAHAVCLAVMQAKGDQ
jgi:hypothetical protein